MITSLLIRPTGRIAAKRQTADIKFTHRPKIIFFAPRGRLVAPIQAKLCRADWHVGPLGCAKFHLNRHRGWEFGHQNIKNFHFLVKSRPAWGDSLDRFRKFLGAFMRLTILHYCFKFNISQITELLLRNRVRRSIRSSFSMHPVGKTMRWIEK